MAVPIEFVLASYATRRRDTWRYDAAMSAPTSLPFTGDPDADQLIATETTAPAAQQRAQLAEIAGIGGGNRLFKLPRERSSQYKIEIQLAVSTEHLSISGNQPH